MSKPDPPTPPNPIATAAAQTGTNVATGVANAWLNNTNQITPNGNLTYDATSMHPWTDPSTGQTYQVPQFTATQTLSPIGQQIQDQSQAAKLNLAQMGNQQSASIKNLLSSPLDTNFNTAGYFAANPDALQWFESGTSGITDPTQFAKMHIQAAKNNPADGSTRTGYQAPQAGNASGILGVPQAATSYNTGGPIQNSLNLTGNADPNNIQNVNSNGFDLASVQKALMGQMQPQLDIQKNQLQQQLADQGIRYGSAAYNNAFTPFNQQENNAWMQSITGATGQQAQYIQTQNAAQQQAYEQALGQGSFVNQAQGQQYQQNAALAAFGNAGLAQNVAQQQSGFNAEQAARNQYMQEQYAARNQPLNETSALLSGSQVQSVPWLNTPSSQIPTTDFAGITNQNFQNQMGIYNAQNQQYNALMGGLLGLGAGAIKASDERVKDNVERIGTVLAAEPDEQPKMASVFGDEAKELPIYSYSYKADPASTRHIGPMAQDVEKVDPKAVKSIGGVKHIDTRRVMGSILRAA